MNQQQLWEAVNQNLIAKSIGELAYEQIIKPVRQSTARGQQKDHYILTLKSGAIYDFEAWLGIWDHLKVSPNSIRRTSGDDAGHVISAGQFFIDAQADLAMTDIILGNFLEEMHSTLFSDVKILQKNLNLSAETVSGWDGHKVQTVLNGHPKILLNKGRMGWGQQDLAAYAPEGEPRFQLFWIALARKKTNSGFSVTLNAEQILNEALTPEQIFDFKLKIQAANKKPEDYVIIPVHPWQWDQVIGIQFAGDIANADLIALGLGGGLYTPQISIRSLSNVTRPDKPDIKLPLTILNTSAIRGIPSRYISSAPQVADAVARICDEDALLKELGTEF